MSGQGRAVLDARRVQHVASERDGFTVGYWLFFDTVEEVVRP